jgi:hypothetical protein
MDSGKFVKGQPAWNKGLKGVMKSNKTSFTSEQINEIGKAAEGKPKITKDWVMCLSSEKKVIIDARSGKPYKCRKRMSYAKYVLEQRGIEVPKGCVVYHKDGDMMNNEIENLEVITRAELFKRNREKIYEQRD